MRHFRPGAATRERQHYARGRRAVLLAITMLVALGLSIAWLVAGMRPAAATEHDEDGVTLAYVDDAWQVTLDSAQAWEVKLIDPAPQEIACGQNVRPCDATVYRFASTAECVMVQVDWRNNVHNSSDPKACKPKTPPTPEPTEPPTTTEPEPETSWTPPSPSPSVPVPSSPEPSPATSPAASPAPSVASPSLSASTSSTSPASSTSKTSSSELATAPELARTGINPIAWVAVVGVLCLAGVGALAIGRRRSDS